MNLTPRCWIEERKVPGQGKIYNVRWFEIVEGKRKKKKSPNQYSKAEATAWQTTKAAQLAATTPWQKPRTNSPLLSLEELANRYVAARLADGGIGEGYGNSLKAVIRLIQKDTGWENTQDITPEAFDRWRASDGGRGNRHQYLRAVLRYAAVELAQPLPAVILQKRIKRRDRRTQPDLLTDAHVAQIRALAQPHGEAISLLLDYLMTFGCRPIDLCRLQVGDWNPHTSTITRRKTKNGSDVAHVVDATLAARFTDLAGKRSPAAAMFTNPRTGEPWKITGTGTAQQLGDWYQSNLTFKIPDLQPNQRGIYCLKDYAITRMDQAGIEVRAMVEFTGIRTHSVYQRYLASNATRQRETLAKIPTPPPPQIPAKPIPTSGHQLVPRGAPNGAPKAPRGTKRGTTGKPPPAE